MLTVNQGTLIVGAGFTGDGAWKGNVTINNTATLQFAQSNIFGNSDDFTIDAGGNTVLTVSLTYQPSTADANKFNSLRSGDYVRFYGVYLNNTRVELRQFY